MLNSRDKIWKIIKLSNRNSNDKICEALERLTTTSRMSDTLMSLLLTPPICNKQEVSRLSKQVALVESKGISGVTSLNESQ